jgi:ribosome maturation factor RimP
LNELAAMASDLHKELVPHLSDTEFILEEVDIRKAGRRLLVQISFDSENVLNLDDIASVSRKVDHIIEDENLLGDRAFTLEVSSRGIDRPLTHIRHFRKNVSRMVEVTTDEETFIDRIKSVDGTTIEFESHSSLELQAIKNALVQIEFKKLDSNED